MSNLRSPSPPSSPMSDKTLYEFEVDTEGRYLGWDNSEGGPGIFGRIWHSSLIRRIAAHSPNLSQPRDRLLISQRSLRRMRFSRFVVYLIGGYLMVLGAVQILGDIVNALSFIYPDEIQWVIDHWGQSQSPTEFLAHWPTDAFGGVKPVSCHSHNDEWREVPLFSAVSAGCTSVEADVWYREEEIYVGHSTSSLTPERTLRSLYLQPLLDLLDKQNPSNEFHQTPDTPQGVFDTEPEQSLVLMIDFKQASERLWYELQAQLSDLRSKDYLTYFNGTAIIERPVTIVASGYAPFDLITTNTTYRDVFYDAPLEKLADLSSKWQNPNRVSEDQKEFNNAFVFLSRVAGLRPTPALAGGIPGHAAQQVDVPLADSLGLYNSTNSYYGSVSFTKSIGYIWGSRVSQTQLQLIRAQVRGAHERGLKVRYWGLPYWPAGLRNHVWHILMREGVDVLSVDDLVGATKRDWRKCKGWFC